MPKHDGQEMVASRELQWLQRVASVEAAAPQFGQLSVCAAMPFNSPRRISLRKFGLSNDYTNPRKLFFPDFSFA